MLKQQNHWCEVCDKEVFFDRNKDYVRREEILTFKGEIVTIKDAKIPICNQCHHEISDEILDSELMKKSIEVWQLKTGKVF